jgi:hypothetical protein
VVNPPREDILCSRPSFCAKRRFCAKPGVPVPVSRPSPGVPSQSRCPVPVPVSRPSPGVPSRQPACSGRRPPGRAGDLSLPIQKRIPTPPGTKISSPPGIFSPARGSGRAPGVWSTIHVVNYLSKVGDHTTPCFDNFSLTSVTSPAIFLEVLSPARNAPVGAKSPYLHSAIKLRFRQDQFSTRASIFRNRSDAIPLLEPATRTGDMVTASRQKDMPTPSRGHATRAQTACKPDRISRDRHTVLSRQGR